ncbi:UNVERIFIED_CONTAM: hypothetical protein HDU68_011193 [Siphonaria sp. JEL0065]|nr:hypothetical protein HDU68_011193 [Siphonaria sp. JEL0065]
MHFISTHTTQVDLAEQMRQVQSNPRIKIGGGQEIVVPLPISPTSASTSPTVSGSGRSDSTENSPTCLSEAGFGDESTPRAKEGSGGFGGPVLGYDRFDDYSDGEGDAEGSGSNQATTTSTSKSSKKPSSSWFFSKVKDTPKKQLPEKWETFVSADASAIASAKAAKRTNMASLYAAGLTQSQPLFAADQAALKMAYAGLVVLLLRTQRLRIMANTNLGAAQLVAFEDWAENLQSRLLAFVAVKPSEQKMIENLALHGVLPQDLARSLIDDSEKALARAQAKAAKSSSASLSSHSSASSKTASAKSVLVSDFKDIRFTVLSHLYIVCVCEGLYDSRSRTLLRSVARYLLVDWWQISALEDAIADQLKRKEEYEKALRNGGVVKSEDKTVADRNLKDSQSRWIYAGLATLAGGAVIGVTAGLAAPLIASGITAAISTVGGSIGVGSAAGITAIMGGTTGIALITGGGASIGGGLTGYKMLKRTKGITEFEFIGIEEAMLEIRNGRKKWSKEERKKKRIEEKKKMNELVADGPSITPGSMNATAASSKDEFVMSGSHLQPTSGNRHRRGSTLSVASEISVSSGVSSLAIEDTEPAAKSSVLITVAGWVGPQDSKNDFTLPFSTLSRGVHGEQYSLVWETRDLVELGHAVKLLKAEVTSFVVNQGIQYFLLPVLMAGLTTPMWLMKLTYMVDNPWGNGLSKAKKAGRLLADTLLSRVQGNRPVTLVGYSLGARVIYYCLLELSTKGDAACGLVEEAYLFGCPVMATQREWRAIASVVSGRLVNGYMTNDWILSILYRASSSLFSDVCGLNPVKGVSGVENICLDGVLKGGHLEYRAAMPRILKYVGFSVEKETFDDYRGNADSELKKEDQGVEQDVLIVASEKSVAPAADGKGVALAPIVVDLPVTKTVEQEYDEMKKQKEEVEYRKAEAMVTIAKEKEKALSPRSSWFGFGGGRRASSKNDWL